MPRKIILHREYKGCTIWADSPPPLMKYTAFTVYRYVRADTLAGIKRLISQDMDTKRK